MLGVVISLKPRIHFVNGLFNASCTLSILGSFRCWSRGRGGEHGKEIIDIVGCHVVIQLHILMTNCASVRANRLLDPLCFFLDLILVWLPLCVLLSYRLLIGALSGLDLVRTSTWLVHRTRPMSLARDSWEFKRLISLFYYWSPRENKWRLHICLLLLQAGISSVANHFIEWLLYCRGRESSVIFVFGVLHRTVDSTICLLVGCVISSGSTCPCPTLNTLSMRTTLSSLILVFEFEVTTLLLFFYVIKAQLHPLSVSIHQCLLRLHMMIVGSWIYSYGSRFIALTLSLLVGLATWC